MIEKIRTFKSGFFVFSSEYTNNKIFKLQTESGLLFQTVKDLPVLPGIASQLQEDLIKKSIHSTAALEGNPLTEERVAEILDKKGNVQDTEKSILEIKNLERVYDVIRNIKNTNKEVEIDEELIKNLHLLITSKIDYKGNNPGKYRNHVVKVGDAEHGGVYTPPKIIEDIKNLMSEFIKWINSKEIIELSPIIRAALAHYHLGLIHPFGDGNGRTARILEAYILRTAGIKYVPTMLSNFYYKNMDDYYWAFSKSIKDKKHYVTPFLEFTLFGVVESLKEIKEKIIYHIRILALRDYYHFLRSNKDITQRQSDLLTTLLDGIVYEFTFKDLSQNSTLNILYRNVSPSSARRDLKKLTERNYLNLKNDGKYSLNLRALD